MKQYTSPRITTAGSVVALTGLDIATPGQEFGSLLVPGGPGATT